MLKRIGFLTAALGLLVATSAAAQQVYSGSVLRVDPGAGVIVLEDGRMFQTTADTVIISGNQRVPFSALAPRTNVMLYSAQPVALRDGRYVLLSEIGQPATGPVTAVVPPPPPPPPAAVATAPPAVVAVPGAVASSPVTVTTTPAFEVSGNVLRADPTERVIQFTDRRTVHLTDDTQVLLGGTQPVPLSTLKPGLFVVVRGTRPFAGSRGEWVPMTEVARGTVARYEAPGAIVLSDGRTIRTTPDTVVIVDNRPVTWTTVPSGTRVVVYQDGSATAVVNEPSASPALVPQGGLKEKEMDRQGR